MEVYCDLTNIKSYLNIDDSFIPIYTYNLFTWNMYIFIKKCIGLQMILQIINFNSVKRASSHIVKRGHRKFEITCKLNYWVGVCLVLISPASGL